jgi:hypothetical protein
MSTAEYRFSTYKLSSIIYRTKSDSEKYADGRQPRHYAPLFGLTGYVFQDKGKLKTQSLQVQQTLANPD